MQAGDVGASETHELLIRLIAVRTLSTFAPVDRREPALLRRPAAELAIAQRMTDLHPTLRATDSAPSDPRPLALLERLASARLPVMVAEDAEIELVRVLQLSGSLKASVPEPRRTLHGHLQAPATVTEVTRLGLQLLGSFVRCRTSWRLRATPHAPLYRRAAGCGQIGE